MNHNLLIQLLYHGTMMFVVGFAFFRYLLDYIKADIGIKLKEEILKISFIVFISFLFLFVRALLEFNQIKSVFICYLFILEVFMDLFIFFTLLKLFYYIRTSKIPDYKHKKKKLFIILADFFVWVILSLLQIFLFGLFCLY